MAKDTDKLSIWNELENADIGNMEYYNSFTPEEKNKFSAFPLMRWMSCIGNNSPVADLAIELVNDYCNKHFWDLNDKELQWKRLACCGTKTKQKHTWIANPKKNRTGKLDKFLTELYPLVNDFELSIIKLKLTPEKIKEIIVDYGREDNEATPLIEDLKKYQSK